MDDDHGLMQSIAEEDRPAVRERLSRNSGYTGISILNELKKLYGFDVSKDLVYDMMHNIPMNVVSRFLNSLISEGTFDPVAVDNKLKTFPWTAGTHNDYNLVTEKRIKRIGLSLLTCKGKKEC